MLQLNWQGLSVIKAFKFDPKILNFDNLRPFMPVCDYFLFMQKVKSPGVAAVVLTGES